MKIVCLKGGLGNQMFEYCRFRDLKESGLSGVYLYYDRRRLKQHGGVKCFDCFDIGRPACPWRVSAVVGLLKICRGLGVLRKLYDDERPTAVLIDDFCQDRRFISNACRYFSFRPEVKRMRADVAEQIRAAACPVAVHVRRGDYLHPSNLSAFGVCGADYFRTGIQLVKDRYPEARFFFFSDDMEWVRQQPWAADGVCVERNGLCPDYVDLYLMTLCRHHIISNSTFGFWGAYLAAGEGGTNIYPKRWFAEPSWADPPIFPSSWIAV